MLQRADVQHRVPTVGGAAHLAGAVKSSSGGGADLRETAGAVVTGTTDARTSGVQKIACSLEDFCGSWAKADAPPPPEFVGHFAVGAVRNHCFVVALVVNVHTKAFPGDVGDISVL